MLRKSLWLTAGFIGVLMLLMQSQSIEMFVASVQNGSSKLVVSNPFSLDGAAIPAVLMNDNKEHKIKLMEAIQQEAPKRRIAPINAKVDSVWKAIPGYNGVEVDIERTYKLAEPFLPSHNITYIMNEIPPDIQLEDLAPNPIYKGNPMKPMVSLMINVAWGNEHLPGMLETLEKEKVHATFFFDGSWLKNNIELAKTIGSYGHELSNHAYSHKNMSQLSRARAIEEISRTQELLTKELGVTNTLFAPPSGDFDQETVQIAAELKLKTVLWTLDTVDWKRPGAKQILDKISKRVEPGTMILMHPTPDSKEALQGMIRIIKQKGYVLGTVSELLSSDRVQLSAE